MKWSWFKVPVKVEHINEYLFSYTVQGQKTKSGGDEISQGLGLLLIYVIFHFLISG